MLTKYDIIFKSRKGAMAKVDEIEAESKSMALFAYLKKRMRDLDLKFGRQEVNLDEHETVLRSPHGKKIWQPGYEMAYLSDKDEFYYRAEDSTDHPITKMPPYFTPEQVNYVNELACKQLLKF